MTAAQLGLPEKLEAAGCTVYARGRSWDRKDTDKGVTAPVYISSANGVAETGELVNIDGTGNRVAATLYGPEKVYFIVGLNKLAPTLEAAIWRARNIASPLNAKRLNRKTPCALSEVMKCYDCQCPRVHLPGCDHPHGAHERRGGDHSGADRRGTGILSRNGCEE